MRAPGSPTCTRRRVLFVIGAGAFGAWGCASAPEAAATSLRRLQVAGSRFAVQSPAGAPATWVIESLPDAMERLALHGLGHPLPVLIRVHDRVGGFVRATGQTESYLRAWSGFATVDILNPDHWGEDSEEIRRARLAHELVHCAIFQAFSTAERALAARVPFFFAEGVASVIAGQGPRRMPLDEVLAAVGERPSPVSPSLPSPVRYGAAHHAMAALAARFGPTVFARVIANAGADPSPSGSVERALKAATGLHLSDLWPPI